jgi:hypothetical protein
MPEFLAETYTPRDAPAGSAVARPRTSTESRCPMHATTPLPVPQAARDARCEALFASVLQPSDTPTAGMVAAAITSAVRRFGPRGCTELMAQEFGDHPDAAARRMRWARLLAAQPAAPRPPAQTAA